MARLRPKRTGADSLVSAADLSPVVTKLAGHIADASRDVQRKRERERARMRAQARAALVATHGLVAPVDEPASPSWSSALPPELGKPAAACETILGIAKFLQVLAKRIRDGGLDAPLIPAVYFRLDRKQPRRGERIDVEASIKAHLRWLDSRVSYFGGPLVGRYEVKSNRRPGADLTEMAAVCRSLDELMHVWDSDLARAIRRLAEVVADVAGHLDALATRIEGANPALWDAYRSLPDAPILFTDAVALSLPPTAALAAAVDQTRCVAGCLRTLEREISTACLHAPCDHAPRGGRPAQVTFLAAIKHLDEGGFSEREIADLLIDGSGDAIEVRARRIRANLDRDKSRDRRTIYI